MTAPVIVRVSARTDVGNHREHNEDNFLVADLTVRTRNLPDEGRAVGEHGILLAVCDGMGGAAAGEVASDMAIETLFEILTSRPEASARTSRDELALAFEAAVKRASERIHQNAVENPARQGMGTTVTAAGLVDDHLIFTQVGDTRGYILRDDTLVQVTRDQSLLAKLLESGALKPEDAATFEHGNIILQALGASPEVITETTYVQLRRGDRVLICSDGLSGLVPADEIEGILGAQAEPTRICVELIERAKELGGDDNVTAIVAFFDGAGLGTGAVPVVVRRFGKDPALPPIPDPRDLGKLLLPMATTGSTLLSNVVQEAQPEPEAVAPPYVSTPTPAPAAPSGRFFAPSFEPTPLAPPYAPMGPSASAITSSRPAPSLSSSRPARSPSYVSFGPEPIAATSSAVPAPAPPPRSSKAWILAAVVVAFAVLGGSALYALVELRASPAVTPAVSASAASAAGVSTWTNVESSGNDPAAGSVAPADPRLPPAPVRTSEVRGGSPRVEAPRPPVSGRAAVAAPPGSARKGELAPLRDEQPE